MARTLCAACLVLATVPLAPPGGNEQGGAATGSFRAAQEAGLDLSLRPADLLNLSPGSAPTGSFRAAQDIGTGWSRLGGYDGPGAPPPWAGGREQPLESRPRF